ncbi:MAG: prefoldin subunit beta [Candidatus Bathyarchaeia archaeon]
MGETAEIPPQLQEQIARLQQLQQTLQLLLSQKQQVDAELSETDHAIEELQKLGADAVVFKSVGAVLVRKGKVDLEKELTEKKELLSVRTSVLGKQEEKTKEKLRELEQTLQAKLRPAAGRMSPS